MGFLRFSGKSENIAGQPFAKVHAGISFVATAPPATNAPSPHEYWKSRILYHTKERLRFLFVSNYRAVAWSTFIIRDDQKPRDRARKSLKEKLDGNKASRGSRRGGWRIGRRIVPRPYDMYGEPEEPDDGVD